MAGELLTVSPQAADVVSSGREVVLQTLLGVDYAEAKDRGLFELFYHNPESGHDGLVHILGGELKYSKNGIPLPGGFHHEPSVPYLWPGPDDNGHFPTYTVEPPDYPIERWPMAPYRAEVVIGGTYKRTPRRIRGQGAVLVPAENTFFPQEYSPYAVLRAIEVAYRNRHLQSEELCVFASRPPMVESFGEVPLVDGQTMMGIKFVLDFETDTIISAIPRIPASGTGMQLTNAEMWHHLTSPTPALVHNNIEEV